MKRKSLLSFARVAATSAAAVAITVMAAGPAAANPSLATRQGSEVQWTALSGETNTVDFGNVGGQVRVSDGAGVFAGPGCTSAGPNAVDCGPVAGTTRFRLTGGDQNDQLNIQDALTIPSDINSGPGQDSIDAANGSDRITDPDGWPTLPAGLTVAAKGGNDIVIVRNGGFDRVHCGTGFDTVIADPAARDFVDPLTCERVIRY
ncbi:hypothetical protein [Streptomyces sp. SYSU K21746]